MKLVKTFIFFCILMICAASIHSTPIPPNIIAAIEASTMTPELASWIVVDSNLSDTDSDGNTALGLAALYSLSYFFTQLFNLNPTGLATIINQPNNFDITPLRAAISNPNGKYEIQRIIQFLLRHGAN